MADASGRGCCEVIGMEFDEEYSFQTTEDALNSLEAEEVDVEAFEEGGDKEQVVKGQENTV